MREIKGDLWRYDPPAEFNGIYRGVPTNGVVRNGRLVMGAGIALDAKKQFPELPELWGKDVEEKGNIPHFGPHYVSDNPYDLLESTGSGFSLFSFPTKNHYNQKSDLSLILSSAVKLANRAIKDSNSAFILPRPGVGLGGLDWRDVRPGLLTLLPDNVYIVTL